MIKVNVDKQSNYPVSSPKLKKRLRQFLEKEGVASDVEVSIALVDEKKMRELAKSYLKEKPPSIHNVLSFPATEVKEKFIYPPDKNLDMGEIVVCFPKAKEEAREEGKETEEKVGELVEHGALHLMGKHHD